MTFKSRSLRYFMAVLSCLAISAVLLPRKASMQQPQSPRSYDQFIIRAYQGALGRTPTCLERQNEYNNLVNAAANGTLLAEARRFVATLFMTQASYDDPNNFNYLQTSAYQARNPQDMNDLAHLQAFVTDLYHAFLQREPDTEGLNFWVSNAQSEGRKKVIRAFELSIEFGDLVNQMFDGGPPSCCIRRTCPRGSFFDTETCTCEFL
ncbi:MAG TPA: DUF4214 domain-containing protein [Pyrinomonadaceae bacterium]|jgi:hypothetical protein